MSLLAIFVTLHLTGCTSPSLPCFSLLFVLLLFAKPPQIATLTLVFLFLWDGFVLHLLYNITDLCPQFFRHTVN